MEPSKLEDVIRYLLNHHAYLHEKRVQKLVFLADLHSIQTRGKRLVDADFKRYYYGVHSDRVADCLADLDGAAVAADVAPDGAQTLKFLRPRKPFATPNLTAEDRKILDEVLEAYRGMSTEELAQIGKTTILWKQADFGEVLDYDAYLQDPASRMSPKMKRAFDETLAEVKKGKLKTYRDVDEMLADSR